MDGNWCELQLAKEKIDYYKQQLTQKDAIIKVLTQGLEELAHGHLQELASENIAKAYLEKVKELDGDK
jgi:hypothetical protein